MAVSYWLQGVGRALLLGRDFLFLKAGDEIPMGKNVLPCQNNSYLPCSCWLRRLPGVVSARDRPLQGSLTPFSMRFPFFSHTRYIYMNTLCASILFNWRKSHVYLTSRANRIQSATVSELNKLAHVHSSAACGTSYWAQLRELRIPYGCCGAWYLPFKQAPHMIPMQEGCSPN